MPASIDRDLAATVLLEAVYTTDELATKKYGVSVRSLQRWRRQFADGDPELAGLVATKRAALDAAWAENLPAVLSKGVQALDSCFVVIQGDAEAKKNPNVIHAVAGALRICAEIHYTGKVIDARLTNGDSATDKLFGKSAAATPTYEN
jgi:hypothetical protein